MKINKKENELLFILSMTTFIVYGGYALLSLVVMSYIPVITSLILLGSLLLSVFLIINYELNFIDNELDEEIEQVTEVNNSLVEI